ncbi:glycosyltransferase family 4 protein [Telmatobacter bradus]|uniref:glycosyltransferase family 4 protein n=1 Tax=Telmatobacter bradus TaxID=474953 RepID=UPI003B42924C
MHVQKDSQGSGPAAIHKNLRCIVYALGPGDVAGHFRLCQEGKQPPFQMCNAFSEQFFEACRDRYRLVLISSHERRDVFMLGPHRMENLPRSPLYARSGLGHHLDMFFYGLGIVFRALRNRASAVIVDSGTTHWFLLALLWLFRIPVIAVFHNTLWPAGFPPQGRAARLLLSLNGWFFRRIAAASACVSPECMRQVQTAAGQTHGPVYQYRAQYRTGFLSTVPPPDHASTPFRILFLGRIQDFKGVFLLLDAAEQLEREFPGRFVWKIVGSGPAEAQLTRQIQERGLQSIVQMPGPLANAAEALATLTWAHLVTVPTTSAFFEGLAMTAAEAALSGRPALVSSVVPAAEVLGAAALRFETDNLDAFTDALRLLAFDATAYAHAQQATAAASSQFYDRSRSLGAVLEQALAALFTPS